MTDKTNEQLINKLDPTLITEETSNDRYFESPEGFEVTHNQNIIEKLIHLSRFGNLLTLVVGNIGSGKTYLLEKLLSSLDDNCTVCHINAQPLLSIDQLFQQVIESFNTDSAFTDIPLTTNQYEQWTEQLSTISDSRLLIIDDAEVLSASVLHELCKLSAIQQEKETAPLQIVLFGSYDLNNVLEQASKGVLEEDGIYTIDIPALNDTQSKKWLNYLFSKAGVVFLPHEEEMDNILSQGQGNLVYLQELATEFSAFSHEIDDIDEEPERWNVSAVGYWFGALTLIILLILGVFFFQKELGDLIGIGSEQPKVEQVQTEETGSEEVVEQIISDTSLINESIKDRIATETYDKYPASVIKNSEESDVQAKIEDKAQEKTVDAKDKLEDSLVAEVMVEKEKVEVELKPAEKNNTTESTLTEFEQLLMNGSDESYVLQIIGLSKESSVKAFISEHNLEGMIYFKSSLNGKPWYIVVINNFATKNDAVNARINLPEQLMKHGPWVKSLKAIKNDITKSQALIN